MRITHKQQLVQVGGNGGAKPRLAVELTRDVSTEEALAIIDKVIKFYKNKGEKKHRRLGILIRHPRNDSKTHNCNFVRSGAIWLLQFQVSKKLFAVITAIYRGILEDLKYMLGMSCPCQ